ncbi:PEF-CTERM sorting domain-containing protein [Methanolobus sp. ZRKC5]|uniref:PEF-CTERM sorting domain-containing protein n=1 Tax=Methanolobus sp. ZRKC5 TaxID=3136295 RepID=UPI00313E62A8
MLDENGYMFIATAYPTDCFCIVFASDSNDGYTNVYVDGEKVWEGDTWAINPTGQPIGAQKIRSLKITGLDNDIHNIIIENPNVDHVHNGHVTIYKYGYNCQQENIPEFPTVALPVAAILGLAFFFQRRKE